MKRVFNLLLIVCALCLGVHILLTVVTEKLADTRQLETTAGKAGVRAYNQSIYRDRLYPLGGKPYDSAVLFNFSDSGEPDTIEVVHSPVFFDHDGSGRAVKSGWINKNSGFLVVIRAGQGGIENGRDLIGNHYLNGEPYFQTGMDALLRQDANGDGRIDAEDPIWPSLRVWRDVNINGQAEKDELFTLDSLDIASISLSWSPVGRFLPDHNYLYLSGFFNYADGRQGRMDEVFFQRRPLQRKFTDRLSLPPALAAEVPEVKGSGWVRDLPEAAGQSPALFELVERFQKADRQSQLALKAEIAHSWADTFPDYLSFEDRAAGRYNIIKNNSSAAINPELAGLIKTMDIFTGDYVYRLPHELYPGQELNPAISISGQGEKPDISLICPAEHGRLLSINFSRLVERIYYSLLPSSARMAKYFDGLDLQNAEADFSQTLALFDRKFESDPASALADLLDFRLALLEDEKSAALFFPALEKYIDDKAKPVESSLAIASILNLHPDLFLPFEQYLADWIKTMEPSWGLVSKYQTMKRGRDLAVKEARQKKDKAEYQWGKTKYDF